MGTPIINPWLFYWADVADIFKSVGGILFFLFVVVSGTCLNCMYLDKIRGRLGEDNKACYLISKKIFTVCLALLMLAWLVPSKKTIYKMYAAKFVTYENAQMATDKIDEYFNKMVKAMEKSKAEKRGGK